MVKTPEVTKAIPVSYDLGNLAVADSNPFELGKDLEKSLYDLNRENVQLLVNQILQLPRRSTTESNASSSSQDSTMPLLRLPDPLWLLPREKPVPKPKPPTRWEQFAAKKGIKKKAKDGKLVYDEESQKFVPKWGYGGINKKAENDWLVEMPKSGPKNDDGEYIDPRKLSRDERKRLVKKNQVQQKRNNQRAMA